MNNETTKPARRWASVRKAASHADLGLTRTWQLIRDGSFFAIRCGRKVIVDLGSIDRHFEGCPRVGIRPLDINDLGAGALADLGQMPLSDSGRPLGESQALAGTLAVPAI